METCQGLFAFYHCFLAPIYAIEVLVIINMCMESTFDCIVNKKNYQCLDSLPDWIFKDMNSLLDPVSLR